MYYQSLKDVISSNDWLSGMADYRDGDLMAIYINADYFSGVTECKSISDLLRNLKNYTGIFKYDNYYFANHWNYGCFVIVQLGPQKFKEFEHLTIECFDVEKLKKCIEDWNIRFKDEAEFWAYDAGSLLFKSRYSVYGIKIETWGSKIMGTWHSDMSGKELFALCEKAGCNPYWKLII